MADTWWVALGRGITSAPGALASWRGVAIFFVSMETPLFISQTKGFGKPAQKTVRTEFESGNDPRRYMNNFSGSKRAWKNPDVSLTTSNVLVTRDTTYRTGLRDNNRGFRNFQRAFLTGHAHSTLNEPGFESVLKTSSFRRPMWLAATCKNTSGAGRAGLFLSFPSSLALSDLCKQSMKTSVSQLN